MIILIIIYSHNLKYSDKEYYFLKNAIIFTLCLTSVVLTIQAFIIANIDGLKMYLYIISITLNIASFIEIIIFLKMQNKDVNTDYLTGAYSRGYLDQYIKKIIHTNQKCSISCILIDIDKFKQVNDRFGHGVGDEVLKMTVELLNKALKDSNKNDFVARYGGDEFYILLHTCDTNILECTVNKIKNIFKEYNNTVDDSHKIFCSIGYDVYKHSAWNDCYSFQNHVDKLMYINKK